MKNKTYWVCLLGLTLLILFSCSDTSDSSNPTNPAPDDSRSFYMGFSPWPYRAEGDYAEVLYLYNLIQSHGDIVAHHYQQGVPWAEAYDMKENPQMSALPDEVTGEFGLRSGFTDTVKRIYLSVDSLNTERSGISGYFGTDYDGNGSTEQQPMPDNSSASPDIDGYPDSFDWGSFDFSDPEIADAFISYSIALIDAYTAAGFEVAYYNYAAEISELSNDSLSYTDFYTFAQRVYDALKVKYPNLPLMISLALKHPDSQESADMADSIINDTDGLGHGPMTGYFDVLGISVYPYAFFDPAVSDEPSEGDNALADLPADWASQISSMAGGKPVAFTETGWIAEDLTIPAYPLQRYSSEANQARFVEELFAEANYLEAEFIIWFSLVDYSYFWEDSSGLNSDPLSAIWRDSGLYDYDGTTDIVTADLDGLTPATAGLTPREGLEVWNQWLETPRR